MEIAINSWFNHWFAHWFAQHPTVYWLIQHPWLTLITTIILVIFMVRFFVAIYRIVMNSIDRLWLWIIRSPFLLVKFLFGWEFKTKQSPNPTQISNYELVSDREQLKNICDRLDLIQQQQQQILQEIASLKQPLKNVSQQTLELVLPQLEPNKIE